MRFASLGSGSKGNALAVMLPGDDGFLLVDCGFAPRELVRRLGRLKLEIEGLRGILVTHEHSDHVGAAFRVAALQDCPVHLTHGTMRASRDRRDFDESRCRLLLPDVPQEIHGLQWLPVPVPHDANEPVQFVVDDGHSRLGVLTDIGHVTPHVLASLSGLNGFVLETNHDGKMLATGRYPPFLKSRIGGDYGHLENSVSARILSSVDCSRLRRVVAAHLSEENNTPELAAFALAGVLGCITADVCVATQADGSPWIDI